MIVLEGRLFPPNKTESSFFAQIDHFWLLLVQSDGAKRDAMPAAVTNYGYNLFNLLRRERVLRPLVVTYYVTMHCNLNCAYCEDFGARRNPQQTQPPPLEDALRVLRVIRTATDRVILTGGEPLLHPRIDELVTRTRQELGFRGITMLTNASLLHEHEAVLPHLARLVISLDSTDPEFWSEIINVPLHTTSRILENIRAYAAQQARYGYQMVLNCVVSPRTLPGARAVLQFCRENQLLVSFSPQSVMNWPSYDLLVSDDYKAFLAELIEAKCQGAPVLGSLAYLRTLLDFHPYPCYPTLVPRVLPNGELIYPCRPVEKDNNGHGGRPCSLLEVQTWSEAMQKAQAEYGAPPLLCASCYQQCFAEPSLMQAHPLDWLGEWLRFPASRSGSLLTFAPGS
jgi:MoaA/NifB/PqqE/SkfB family radical SAM enzyme